MELFSKQYPNQKWTYDKLRGRIRRKIDKGEITSRKTVKRVIQKSQNVGQKIEMSQKFDDNGNVTAVNFDAKFEFRQRANKTPEDILKYKGYDVDKWRIRNITDNEWSMTNGSGEQYWNYQIKFTAEPKAKEFDLDSYISKIVKHRKPYDKTPNILIPSERYLAIPAFDTHFDGKTLDHYTTSLNDQLRYINAERWQDVVLILGGDIAHVDNVNSTTTKGTQLETTDIAKAVDEMLIYFETLISAVLKHSNHLHLIYAHGNHDSTVGYMFAKMLEQEFKRQDNMSFDIDMVKYKAYMLGNNFIGATHGDKGKNNYVANYSSRFAMMYGPARNRELFTGHLHKEETIDLGGMLQRQVSTRKPTDKWTDDNGYVAIKNFVLVQYSKDRTTDVHYS